MENLTPYRDTLSPRLVQEIARAYGLETPQILRAGGGTASPKLILRCGQRLLLLRRRRFEFCPENRIRFDHAFIHHLSQAGLRGIASPLRARDGRTWVVKDEHAYELVPYIDGLQICDPNSEEQMISAARTLGRLHQASRTFIPPAAKDLGRDLYLPRYLHLLEEQLSLMRPDDAPHREIGERMLCLSKALIEEMRKADPDSLLPIVVHGDYTPANILFRGNDVAGIFDFDWCTRTNRTWDISRGIGFFAFRRKTPLDPNDIASLTEAPSPDLERARRFMAAYCEHAWPLASEEKKVLALFFREMFLCMRVAGMRKLPIAERLAYAAKDMSPLLDWMESSLDEFLARII